MSQRELFIFPCRDKKPLTARGFKDAQPESSWTGEEGPQWGAPTGEINGIFVVDIDLKKDGLELTKHIEWGDTQIVNTPGGGKHVFYKYNKEKLKDFKTCTDVVPGADLRTDGGYIILYAHLDFEKIRDIPENVLRILTEGDNERKSQAAHQTLGALSGTPQDIGEGGRNAYLAKAAGRMQKIGVLTLAALQEVNERDCSPPLEDAEVEAVFRSVSRYVPESTPGEDETPQPKIVWAADMVGEMFTFLRDKGKTTGESSGIKALDDLLGGRRLGELTVTMAEAKVGKNSWWHMQQVYMLDKGIAMAYASRELSPATEVLPNLLTLKLGQNIYKTDVTEEEVMNAINGWRLAFSPGYGAFQGTELWDWLEECVHQGVKYFWLDHMHYMTQDSEDFKVLAEFGRKLKTFTKTHQCSVDLIVQPKVRPSFKIGDRMQKADMDINMLRGGASLGQVLDSLITLDRLTDDEGNLTNVVKIDLKRARSKLAKTGTFFMSYDTNTMRFTECGDPRDAAPARVTNDGPPLDRTGTSPNSARRENAHIPGYGTSKSGEFFDLKRSVSKMLKEIKASE